MQHQHDDYVYHNVGRIHFGPPYEKPMTHYPGVGVDAAAEAFSAYCLLRRRVAALDDAGYTAYDVLVRAERARATAEYVQSRLDKDGDDD